MQERCPRCGAQLPEVRDAFCSACRQDLPEIPAKPDVLPGSSDVGPQTPPTPEGSSRRCHLCNGTAIATCLVCDGAYCLRHGRVVLGNSVCYSCYPYMIRERLFNYGRFVFGVVVGVLVYLYLTGWWRP